jgi:GNAT superfamily N-acetyltransferase
MVESDLDQASEVLGLAFGDYAWTRWVVDSRDHIQRITELDRLFLQHFALPYGNARVTTVEGVVVSVASWIDTGVSLTIAPPVDIVQQFAALEGDRHGASLAADEEYHGWRPADRHLYLATMGTAPSHQRMGLGARTLQAGLDLADRDRLSAYLETSSQQNVDFYSALGFEIVRHWLIADGAGPDLWLMKRAPR